MSTSTSCNFTWEPVNDSQPDPDGFVLGYKVYYTFNLTSGPRSSTVTILGANASAATLLDLWNYKTYSITLVAFNAYGEGNHSEPLYCKTKEDGKQKEALKRI